MIKRLYRSVFFWRTNRQQEIDYLEEFDGNLFAYEFKWNTSKKINPPLIFTKTYPDTEFKVISKDNFLEFVLD